MDKIEFKMQPERKDCKEAIKKRMLKSPIYHIYTAFLIVSFIIIIVLGEIYGGSKYDILFVLLFFGCLIAFILPFQVINLQATRVHKYYYKYGDILFFLDEEGFGVEADLFQWYIKWRMFSSIRETKQYIFMKQIDGSHHVLFKNCLPDETVIAIKKILTSVPIVDKEMLTN
jgi:hypothetical protein